MIRVHLKRGYKSTPMTDGEHLAKGVHELEDGLADYLLDIGIATTVTTLTEQVVEDVSKWFTAPAWKHLSMFSINPAVFERPEEGKKIGKPEVDAFLTEHVFPEGVTTNGSQQPSNGTSKDDKKT